MNDDAPVMAAAGTRELSPIRPLLLTLNDFRGWRGHHELALDGQLILIVGANGAGKSSLLNAIEWCLFGAEVAKKSSGIDERGEWEVAHRSAVGPVEVALTFSVEGGTARMVRARAADARPRDPDELRVELGGDEVLEGEDVSDWMAWHGLPDWSSWKQAFCQHQELLRGRVTDSAERSAQLGALLGLEAYQQASERLKALKTRDLAKCAQTELASIEAELRRSLDRPGRELRELEDRMESRGLARTAIGEPALVAGADRLVAEGRRIADLLDLSEPLPDATPGTGQEVLHWARDWESKVNLRRGEIERELASLRANLRELESAREGIEPARRRRQDALTAWKRWSEEHGSAEELERQLENLGRDRNTLQEEESARDATRQLLRQAAEAIRGREAEGCPVCGHHDPALSESLRQRLAQDDDPMKDRFEALAGRERQLHEQRTRLARLRSELELAEAAHQSSLKDLEARLPAGAADPQGSTVELLREWRSRSAGLQDALGRIEEHLAAHRTDAELFDLLLKWRAARARADAVTGDLGQLEPWNELQDSIDEAAGLVSDLDALGLFAREAQKARSAERVKAANQTLGTHFGRISGRPGDEAVRVAVKMTATRLTYHLVDGAGQDITPILNQAALNALSFAMLFAQAEERARQRLPQWLVLDDPGQSLDPASLAGLAEAVVEVAGRVPLVLATHAGELAGSLERLAPANARVFRLTARPGSDVPAIEEVRR